MTDPIFKEIMQYSAIILVHALSYWLLSGAYQKGESGVRRGVGPVQHDKHKVAILEELHRHHNILALNRLDNIEKGLENSKSKYND